MEVISESCQFRNLHKIMVPNGVGNISITNRALRRFVLWRSEFSCYGMAERKGNGSFVHESVPMTLTTNQGFPHDFRVVSRCPMYGLKHLRWSLVFVCCLKLESKTLKKRYSHIPCDSSFWIGDVGRLYVILLF